jgi:hypothetical protein
VLPQTNPAKLLNVTLCTHWSWVLLDDSKTPVAWLLLTCLLLLLLLLSAHAVLDYVPAVQAVQQTKP